MISKETIISSFDDKETLLKWLKKVESALTGATLTNLVMTKLSDVDHVGTYQITATFGDSTSVVSDTFTLPSVDIVTAFSNLTTLVNGFDTRITDNTNNVGSILDIIDIGNDKINTSTLQHSINGSDDVIVDVDETNEKLEIHLSAELQAKLARVLLKPSSAPSTRKVVTIDTNGAQDNVDGTALTTLMNNIVDSHGNKRFVEGIFDTGVVDTTKLQINYNRWALSGNHLMIVIEYQTIDDYVFTYQNIGIIYLPLWVRNKIVASYSIANNNVVDFKTDIKYYPTTSAQVDISATSINATIALVKTSANVYIALWSKTGNPVTIPQGNIFRVQFDLIIDSD